MKRIACSVFIFIFSFGLRAQTAPLVVKSSNKGPYVEHKVAPKENFYSIGRAFNVHPKHIASFNSLNMAKGLSIGQVIKIPLSDTNYTHKSDKGIPVYYITGNSETVYNVSTNNNVLMEKLRKWNSIPNDRLPPGSKLIVGYLTSNEMLAPAVNISQTETVTNTTPAATNRDTSKNLVVNKPEVRKEEPRQASEKPAADNRLKQTEEEPKTTGGYFKTWFDQQIKQQPATKDQTVTSGIFKTSSGWSDAKYYLLMNGADPGTIVRITNPGNNRTIYAKLLGDMSDLKQNQGLDVRISNAAAVALDISETDKFTLKLNY